MMLYPSAEIMLYYLPKSTYHIPRTLCYILHTSKTPTSSNYIAYYILATISLDPCVHTEERAGLGEREAGRQAGIEAAGIHVFFL